MTSVARPDSRLRRSVRAIPLVGPALRATAITYYESIAAAQRSLHGLRRKLPAARDSASVAGGTLLARGARRLLLIPYRQERVDVPPPLVIGGHRFDVVDDLVGFTSLPRESVNALLTRRVENFRTEWLQTPATLRSDDWFYLSSRMYLFGNAVHFHDSRWLIDEIVSFLPRGGPILDFGGGTGNLALALAALGFQVDYRELSALQKEFARYRIRRCGLEDRISVLDTWEQLQTDRYAGVCAWDVFEHLPDLAKAVESFAASLIDGGVLIGTPTFAQGLSNPMHHEDPGLDSLLAENDLVLQHSHPMYGVWKKRHP